MLNHVGIDQIIICDKGGIISKARKDNDTIKNKLIGFTNPDGLKGELVDAVKGADVFIGVSAANVLTKKMIQSMNEDPIIFAMANPDPEIMPDDAKEAGAKIIATGRSDFPNQVNNVLAFPGLFRGALDARTDNITNDMFTAAAHGIAGCLEKPTPDNIIPSVFDHDVAPEVAEAVAKVSREGK